MDKAELIQLIESDRVEPQPPLPQPNPWSAQPGMASLILDDAPEPRCSQCQLSVTKAEWVYLSSPEETWANLCGREGWLAYCPEHYEEIFFSLEALS